MKFRLVLLDRDGVLNVNLPGSVRTPAALEMIPGSAAAVARLCRAGLKTALVTNQAVLGRGEVDEATFDAIQQKLLSALAAEGGRLDTVHVAPDMAEQATPRRKPGPGMLTEALNLHGLWPDEAVMVGDSLTDLQAARAASVGFVLVRTGWGEKTLAQLASLPGHSRPDHIAADLADAVGWILGSGPAAS
jgi:D-glycero-D-manno-heptose 1,7-bisphosphate phosphatase